jgi:signal transduction histidine kinase
MIFKSYLINNLVHADPLYNELNRILLDHSIFYESDFDKIKLKNEIETDLIILLDEELNKKNVSICKHLNKRYPTTPIVVLTKKTNLKIEEGLYNYNLIEFIAMEDCSSDMLVRCIKFYALRKKTIAMMTKNETLETIQQFSAAVAHEFRQPLQVIAGYLQILEMKQGESFEIEKSKEMIYRIEELIKTLNNINGIKSKNYTSKEKIMDLLKSTEAPK